MDMHDEVVSDFIERLPEGFIANAMGLTSPQDVCRLSLVCSVFRSAGKWDAVWEKFLLLEYQDILAACGVFGSKKDLYLRLCDNPVIMDDGKSFWLHKPSAKKCYMLAARDLSIVWGDTPRYWRWTSVPESRFTEVAELRDVCWFEVHGRIDTSILSTNTRYVAYLVYKPTPHIYGFEDHPADVSVGLFGVESRMIETVFLDPKASGRFNTVPPQNGPKRRRDEWLEIELGEFYNDNGQEGELDMRILDLKGGNWKSGLIIQGIEIRPKAS